MVMMAINEEINDELVHKRAVGLVGTVCKTKRKRARERESARKGRVTNFC